MKFEDENFKEEFMKWLNSKTEEEIVQKLKELEEDKKMSADEMLEKLGYKKKNLDIIFSRFWEEWENEDLAKTFSFNTEYKITDITDENKYGITMQELQAINKKVEELGWMD